MRQYFVEQHNFRTSLMPSGYYANYVLVKATTKECISKCYDKNRTLHCKWIGVKIIYKMHFWKVENEPVIKEDRL